MLYRIDIQWRAIELWETNSHTEYYNMLYEHFEGTYWTMVF